MAIRVDTQSIDDPVDADTTVRLQHGLHRIFGAEVDGVGVLGAGHLEAGVDAVDDHPPTISAAHNTVAIMPSGPVEPSARPWRRILPATHQAPRNTPRLSVPNPCGCYKVA